MEHSSRVVLHFSLFKVEVFRLVVRQTRRQTHPVAVLIATTTPTRWPKDKRFKVNFNFSALNLKMCIPVVPNSSVY